MAVHRNVKQALTYILNPDKTDERVLTISLNCMTEPDFAYTQMKTVYEQYARRSYDATPSNNGKSPVKAIHYIMSFADSEGVTPKLAHKIGMAFVRKMFGDDVQAVIAKHVNTDHVHNHILINSYSLTGKRFYDNKASVRKMREVTNGVCRAFGVEPALNFENDGRSLNYSEWQYKKNGTSWKEHIRNAIDSLIPAVNSFDDLLAELEMQGFTVKRDKNILIKAPGQQLQSVCGSWERIILKYQSKRGLICYGLLQILRKISLMFTGFRKCWLSSTKTIFRPSVIWRVGFCG